MNRQYNLITSFLIILLFAVGGAFVLGMNYQANKRQAEIQQIYNAAAEPYKNHTNDTSKLRPKRIESFKKPTTRTVLPTRFRTEESVLQSTQD